MPSVALAMICSFAAAQTPPAFYSPVGTAFTPEIGVVNSGVLHDVQGVVSADEKYVTITMGSVNAGLLALHEFSFQGGSVAAGSATGGAVRRPAPIQVTFLDRRGITRVG